MQNKCITPKLIYCIGDSHCIAFEDRIFIPPSLDSVEYILCKSAYIPGFSLTNSVPVQGIDKKLFEALLSLKLIDKKGRAIHRHFDPKTRDILIAKSKLYQEPIILLHVGELDLRGVIYRSFSDMYDFILPSELDPCDANLRHSHEASLLPTDMVKDMLSDLVKRFSVLVSILKLIGFRGLYWQAIVPSYASDVSFERINNFRCPFAVRNKLTLLLNSMLAEACHELGVRKIDINQKISEGLALSLEYRLDDIHLSPAALPLIVNELATLEQRSQRTGKALKPAYALLLREAIEIKPDTHIATKFAQDKIVAIEQFLNLKQIEELLTDSVFVPSRNLHTRDDWEGNSPVGLGDHIETSLMSPEKLKLLHEVFYQEETFRSFSAILGYEYTVICARLIKSHPHSNDAKGPQKFHRDGCPEGLYRAIVYLTDVSVPEDGAFEFYPYQCSDDADSQFVLGKAGDIFIFDANAILHRGSPPRTKSRLALDIVFMPKLPACDRFVICPGMNHWPVNPYCFSVSGYGMWPLIASDKIVGRIANVA